MCHESPDCLAGWWLSDWLTVTRRRLWRWRQCRVWLLFLVQLSQRLTNELNMVGSMNSYSSKWANQQTAKCRGGRADGMEHSTMVTIINTIDINILHLPGTHDGQGCTISRMMFSRSDTLSLATSKNPIKIFAIRVAPSTGKKQKFLWFTLCNGRRSLGRISRWLCMFPYAFNCVLIRGTWDCCPFVVSSATIVTTVTVCWASRRNKKFTDFINATVGARDGQADSF